MQLFLSTTFYGIINSDISKALEGLDTLDIDGIELGSTHAYQSNIGNIISKNWVGRIVTHNFFPPMKDVEFVMNIASDDIDIRNKSVNHAVFCIKFAASIGAEVYTVHPGFTAKPDIHKNTNYTYDFSFNDEKVDKKISFVNMVKSLKLLIKIAKKNKIRLAIETEGSLTKTGVLLMESMDEYDQIFSIFREDIFLNLNLAHTRFASIEHGFKVKEFIKKYYEKIILVEISHNNGKVDQHLPLVGDSYVFDYLHLLPDVPCILEFRNSTINQIKYSISLMRKYSNEELIGAGH